VYDALSEELRYWKRKTGSTPRAVRQQSDVSDASELSDQVSVSESDRHELLCCAYAYCAVYLLIFVDATFCMS